MLHSGVTFMDLASFIGQYLLQNMVVNYEDTFLGLSGKQDSSLKTNALSSGVSHVLNVYCTFLH